LTKSFVVLIIGNSKSNRLGAQGTFKGPHSSTRAVYTFRDCNTQTRGFYRPSNYSRCQPCVYKSVPTGGTRVLKGPHSSTRAVYTYRDCNTQRRGFYRPSGYCGVGGASTSQYQQEGLVCFRDRTHQHELYTLLGTALPKQEASTVPPVTRVVGRASTIQYQQERLCVGLVCLKVLCSF